MIFKSLKLENIRSFKDCYITFPKGITLFEGDVGSGKSSILMAIEFALFGLGNQKGESLLRKKTNKGSVIFEFEVNEDNYKVKRTLIKQRKKKTRIQKEKDIKRQSSKEISPVWQSEGYLVINEVKSHLSPSEIKEKILDILNFKEPLNPRAQSVIFRYAVYTPQEEMKYILAQKPDIRLQTLRKAFGIEDYKIAAENTTLISKSIKGKINYLSGQISDLGEKRNFLTELNVKLTNNKKNLSQYMEKRDELYSSLQEQKKELDKLKKIESELKQIRAEIPHVETQRDDKVELSSKYNREIQSIEEENQEKLVPEMKRLEKFEKPTDISQDNLKEKLEQIKQAIKNRGELRSNLTLLNETRKGIEDKLRGWKDKNLDEFYIENKRLTNELDELEKLLSSHQEQQQIIIGKIYNLEDQMKDIDKKLKNLDDLGEVCPICGSLLDDAHKKDLKQERKTRNRKLNSEINVLNEVKTKCELEIDQVKTNIKQSEKDLKEFELLIDKFNDLIEVKSQINSMEERVFNIDETLSLNMGENVGFENFDQYIKHLEDLLEKLKDYNQAQQSLEDIKYRLNKNNDKIEENKANMETLKQEINTLNANLSSFQDKIKHLPEIVKKTDELQSFYDNTEKEYSSANNDVISTSTLIETLTQDVLKLEDEIKEKEKLLKQLDKLKDYHIWLNDYLIPTLGVIEKHVMLNIQQEFEENFKKFFTLLIDDPSQTGRIDEEFTPIIEQDGIQQEINYLSGGEKTSVALAYRLALNNIVQKVSTGLKSNLLLLDEPTDGFSKEQLFKIMDILDELNYPQIIIVSHEKELESFADNTFQVKKVDGVSEVSRVS